LEANVLLVRKKVDRTSCLIPKGLLKEAEKFHGHLGSFLVLGLKAGLFANEILGKNIFEMHACVETEPTPPRSCFMDGIQITTGCTMGKHNIELRDGDSLIVTFTQDDQQLTLYVKPDFLKEFSKIMSMEDSKKTALSLVDRPIEDLFDIICSK
jgi:formylmethanofuran dehydrogenase subunit E